MAAIIVIQATGDLLPRSLRFQTAAMPCLGRPVAMTWLFRMLLISTGRSKDGRSMREIVGNYDQT